MANAKQLISLLKSHISGDDPRFYNVAMQIAAAEAKKGHRRVASELKALIDEAKIAGSRARKIAAPVPMVRPKGDLALFSQPNIQLSAYHRCFYLKNWNANFSECCMN